MITERKESAERLSELKLSRNQTDYLVYKYLFRDLRYAIDRYAHGKVLDVGCGNKPYERLFVKSNSYIGCDVVQSSKGLVDIICPATALAFDSNSFDTVFSTQVLEHVDDHHKALEEIYRVLKPGGYFIFSVPFVWELHEEPYDFFRFTKYGIHFLLRKFGFDIQEIIPNGGKWAAVGQLRLNMMWSRFRNRPRLARIYKLIIKYSGLKIILNSYYSFLDSWDFDDLLTLNYVCIAKKNID